MRNGPSFDEAVYFAPPPRDAVSSIIARDRYVLAVGRVEKRKNIDLLIRAFQLAAPTGVKLIIVGETRQGFAPVAVGEDLLWIERADPDLLIALHANADLFVYPSAAEGFGLPLLDSVLFGRPLLSSNQTAMPEVAGELAEYFDPTRPDAIAVLARRIGEHFSGRPVTRPSLAQRRAHAEKFSWRRNTEALAAALRGARRKARRGHGRAKDH